MVCTPRREKASDREIDGRKGRGASSHAHMRSAKWKGSVGCIGIALAAFSTVYAAQKPPAKAPASKFHAHVTGFLKKHCIGCHTGPKGAANVDLAKIRTEAEAKKHIKVLRKAVGQINANRMPPKGVPQPSADEIAKFKKWVKAR